MLNCWIKLNLVQSNTLSQYLIRNWRFVIHDFWLFVIAIRNRASQSIEAIKRYRFRLGPDHKKHIHINNKN